MLEHSDCGLSSEDPKVIGILVQDLKFKRIILDR